VKIHRSGLGRRTRLGVCYARICENLTAALEGKPNRNFHPRFRIAAWWRYPATAQIIEDGPDSMKPGLGELASLSGEISACPWALAL
jgi:hypothetical protein